MAFETERDEAAAIEYGMGTPFWTQFMLPALQERAKGVLEALALKDSDDADIKRGWFQALRWVMSMPVQKVEIYRKTIEEAEAANRLTALDEHRAAYGFRSPYPTQAEPGDLKQDESTSSTEV